MRWKTDWLYQLIFRDVEHTWRHATKEGQEDYGPSPDYFVVSQCALFVQPYSEINPHADVYPKLLSATLVGPIIKRWRFDALGLRISSESDVILQGDRDVRGMFYRVGSINFGISPDRKLVVISFVMGRRYARHRVFAVSGQGKAGCLSLHPEFVMWIS